MKTEKRHLMVEGQRLFAKILQPEDAVNGRPLLVFLHEGLGCIEIWEDFPEALCSAVGCPGLVYDRRGYGGSGEEPRTWGHDYLLEEGRRFLPGILTASKAEAAVLIGHSDGGTIALIAAATGDPRITTLITEAAHIFVEDITLQGIRKAVTAYEYGNLRDRLFRFHGEGTDRIFHRWAERWLSPEFRGWTIRELLPLVRCPALVLQGKDDPYGTRLQVRGIGEGIAGQAREMMIPGCGHIPHRQAREVVLEEMVRFIRSHIAP